MTDKLEEAAGLPLTIKRYALLPGDVVVTPRGAVLMTAFCGKTAYAWVAHHPEAPADMQILTVPSEKIITLEVDPLFENPVHVGSFLKTDTSGLVPSAWHCFMFMPKSGGSIILPN